MIVFFDCSLTRRWRFRWIFISVTRRT